MNYSYVDGKLSIALQGRIDSVNAPKVEEDIFEILAAHSDADLSFEAHDMIYISSAGLRVLFKVCKTVNSKVSIYDVSSEVYEIFDITGFVDMFDIHVRDTDNLSV